MFFFLDKCFDFWIENKMRMGYAKGDGEGCLHVEMGEIADRGFRFSFFHANCHVQHVNTIKGWNAFYVVYMYVCVTERASNA